MTRYLVLVAGAAGLLAGCRDPGEKPLQGRIPTALVTADSLLAEGQARYARGDYDSASAALTAAIEASRRIGAERSEGRALTWRGLAAWRGGRYLDARRDGEAGLSIKRKIGDRVELFRSWNALGLLAWNEGRLLDALTLFDSATAAASAEGNREDLGKAAGNRALVGYELGDFRAARRGFEAMLEAGRASGDKRVQGNALTNLSMLAIRVGSPANGLPLLADARRHYSAIDYSGGEQNALAQLATAYQALGRFREAFAVIDTAVDLARRLRQPQDVAANLEVQAQLHRDIGEDRRALALYDEAQRINTTLGLLVEQGTDFRSQAEILRGLGQGASAARTASQALGLHRTAGATFEELVDVLLLAEIEADGTDSAAVARYLTSARELATHLDARTARVALALTEARVAEKRANSSAALSVLAAAWSDLISGSFEAEWQAWDLRAGAELSLGRLEAAATSAGQAVAALERVRAGLAAESQRTSFLARRAQVYARLVEINIRLGRVERGFDAADAMRGRALLDHLRGPDPDLTRVEGLETRLALLERGSGETDGGVTREARIQMEQALAGARRAIRPAPASAVGPDASADVILGAAPAGVEQIRGSLAADEALLAYFVGQGRGHLFVVRQGGIHHVGIPITAERLTARVRLARDVVGRRVPSPSDPVLEALYRLLLTPALELGVLSGVSRIVIVPQGALVYLPFAALRDPGTGRYLAQDFVLSVLPSAASLPALRQRPAVPGLAGGVGFAPVPQALPASRVEVEAFQRAVPGTTLRMGAAATEAEARRALGTAGIVHIASHAEMNPANPLYSRVELAPGTAGDADNDGALEVHELLTLKIRSRFVFLSGCETGLGATWATSYRAGEDYATLGQSLLYAGAGAVVATLWRIDDAAAAVLSGRFYRNLRGREPAEALAMAQRDLIGEVQFSRPYYWAGYALIGALGGVREAVP